MALCAALHMRRQAPKLLKGPGGKTPADDVARDVIGVIAERNIYSAVNEIPAVLVKPKNACC